MSDFINMLAPTGLATFREQAGLSQAQLAKAMQMPLRTYEDLEGGRSKIRPVHANAARMALIELSATTKDSTILNADLAKLIREVAAVLDQRKS